MRGRDRLIDKLGFCAHVL
nr:hypothetical protein [Sicyoidochytrium minutum DNA virus]